MMVKITQPFGRDLVDDMKADWAETLIKPAEKGDGGTYNVCFLNTNPEEKSRVEVRSGLPRGTLTANMPKSSINSYRLLILNRAKDTKIGLSYTKNSSVTHPRCYSNISNSGGGTVPYRLQYTTVQYSKVQHSTTIAVCLSVEVNVLKSC